MAAEDLVERLRKAVDAHDIESLVGCFAGDYRNEWPAHPGRGFVGSEQVRTNWTRMFAGVPDMTARVLRCVVDGDAVWSEWEMGGHRPDGAPQLLRGVIVFGVADEQFAWGRFYLEPVDEGAEGIDAAVGRVVGEER